MNKIQTEEFDLAYKFVTETDSNIFLTGKAGTGKTTFLRYLKENAPKNMAVAAPTGVAAINAGGVTLHSMFQIPFGPFIPSTKETNIGYNRKMLLSRMRFNSDKIKFFNSLELLVIDEASMVPAYIIDVVDLILRTVRHNQKPFGGVQVLFIGDLYQLQPVLKKEEWEILKEYYSSIFFFDSLVLRNSVPVMIELKKIFRQKDEKFIEILNGVRDNKIQKEHFVELNKRLKRGFIPPDGENYITLTTHNHQADTINRAKLNRLAHEIKKFDAIIQGDFPEQMYPAEKELVVKKDAQVMFIKNDLDNKLFYNGKIGVITEISDEVITVHSDGTDIKVKQHVWENIKYYTDPVTKEITQEAVGRFTHFPLRLAWAITIHKSQGLTFEKLVIDAENAFANGQVYVALSRATTLEGLIISSPVNDQFLGAHSDLLLWQEKNFNEGSLPERFEQAKQNYMKEVLTGIFMFNHFQRFLNNLKKDTDEIKDNQLTNWLNEISNLQKGIHDTALKFNFQLQMLWDENPNVAENEKLNSRIKDASVYFTNQLVTLKKVLSDHPIKISSRLESKKIDRTLEELNEQILISATKIGQCKDGFKFNELVAWKKSLPSSKEKIRSSFVTSTEKLRSHAHTDLFDRLFALRNEIAHSRDLSEYKVFSNSAIKNCCEHLPGDENALLEVSGFGDYNVKEFGEEVLNIIREYSEETGIKLNSVEKIKKNIKQQKSSRITETVQKTIDLFRSGKNISEICEVRSLATSTIESHLADAIEKRQVIIEAILSKEEIDKIAAGFPENSLDILSAREKLGDEISYGRIKMVAAWKMLERVDAK